VGAGGWSVSAGFFDYDNDGHLDLFVTRYLDWSVANSKTCGNENAMYAHPLNFPPSRTSCTTIVVMAHSKMSASLQASHRKKATAWVLLSPIMMATASPIFLCE